jgi:Leucine-rich repeat (LRR) protein
LAQLASLSNLQSLNLESCDITDASLAHLASLSRLQSLNFKHCRGFKEAGLAHLASLSNLKSLKLWGCNITDAGIPHLALLANLQSLEIDQYHSPGGNLVHLTRLSKLQWLMLPLAACALFGSHMRRLLPNLQWVECYD